MMVLKTALCGAVLAAAAAAAPAAFAGMSCNLETLQGSYGLSGSGWVTSGMPPAFTPFAVEGRSVYDGKGNFRATETHASNGDITYPVSPSGTYTVNRDCTGTFFVGGNSILNFVIDQGGTHIRAISTTPGNTLTIEYSEQFPQDQNTQ